MKNVNVSRSASKASIIKRITKTQWILLGSFVFVIIVSGIYAAFALQSTRHSLELAKAGQTDDMKDSTPIEPAMADETLVESDDDSIKQPQNDFQSNASEFTFSDTSSWITKSSRDGSFSIKYQQYLIYATCPDLADNLMIAMAGPTESTMACGSLHEAVSWQPSKNQPDSIVLRTETMIAQTDDLADRGGAEAVNVSLSDGRTAQRYEYDTTILGKGYHAIEYNVTVGGKRYVAINNWQHSNSPNTSPARL